MPITWPLFWYLFFQIGNGCKRVCLDSIGSQFTDHLLMMNGRWTSTHFFNLHGHEWVRFDPLVFAAFINQFEL